MSDDAQFIPLNHPKLTQLARDMIEKLMADHDQEAVDLINPLEHSELQTELLNRRRWKTRIELANALFEYLEIFYNRRRRHSALGMLTPIEYETLYVPATA